MKTIAYICGVFPSESETFVYREVIALRDKGWKLMTVALNEVIDCNDEIFKNFKKSTIVLYSKYFAHNLTASIMELVAHPICAFKTLSMAIIDALIPGESLSFISRLKLLVQSVMALGLSRRLRAVGIQHIHCHFAHAPTTVGMYTAKQLNVPFSFTGHANDIFQRRILLKRKLKRATFVACISEWHKQFYQSIYPNNVNKYKLIRCGVDTNEWVPRIKPSPSNKIIQLLTVCRLVEKKGIDTMIMAAEEISKKHAIKFNITIVGAGPELKKLHALVRKLKCNNVIQWLGEVTNDRVRSLMGKADIFVLPCKADSQGDRDGLPVVLIEAMSCGISVIAGDLPAIRELIVDGNNGLLFSGGNAQSLADKIVFLANHSEERIRLSINGRKHVEHEFNLALNITRLEDAFRSALMISK